MAYGYAVGAISLTIAANTDVPFSEGGLGFPNVGLTVPDRDEATFTVLSDGDYEYVFYVAGQNPSSPATQGLVFGIALDGVAQGPGETFRSNMSPANTGDATMVVRGQGILQLAAGTTVTLRNLGAAANLVRSPPGLLFQITANATLSLKKLSA